MNRKKMIKQGSAVALALTLALSAMILPQVRAATAIDTDTECSVNFEVTLDSAQENREDLGNLKVPVNISLYQVASVNEYGEYQTLEGFGDLELDKIDSDTTAEEWIEKAETAMGLVEASQGAIAPVDNSPVILEKNPAGTALTGSLDGLAVGMYLVVADDAYSSQYSYSFSPYLLALPNNTYYETKDDTWQYKVKTDLKPEQTQRYGDLEIEKTLTSYNATVGGASFVFSVDAVLDNETVYSDVVSVVFSEAGTRSILVEDLPAGAAVTVTEIYSGAGYSPAAGTQTTQTVTIVADPIEGEVVDVEVPASVSFENEYNGSLNGGSSVVNHFYRTDTTWGLEQQTDSTGSGAAAQE